MLIKIRGHQVAHLHDEQIEKVLEPMLGEKRIERWSNIEYDNETRRWKLTLQGHADCRYFATREAALAFEKILYDTTNMEGAP